MKGVLAAGLVALAMVPSFQQRETPKPSIEYRPLVTLQLSVSSLDRSIAFYESALGFTVRERRDDLKFAHVATNTDGLELGLGEVASPVAPSPAVVINISVKDVAAARAALEAKGVSFPRPTHVIPGKVSLAEFADPDGHRLRLAGPAPGSAPERVPSALDAHVASLRRQQQIIGGLLVRAADKASEADYLFKPTPEVRSLVELFMHAASAQFYVCGQVAGERPSPPDYLRAYKPGAFKAGEKASVVGSLKASTEYCERILAGLSGERAAQNLAPGFLDRVMGAGEAPVLSFVTVNIAHMNEHYGNVVTYLRLRGIVPPSSEKQVP